MIKKILLGIAIFLLLLIAGGYIYYRLVLYHPPAIAPEDKAAVTLMPLPSSLKIRSGFFALNDNFSIRDVNHSDPKADKAIKRFADYVSEQFDIETVINDPQADMTIDYDSVADITHTPFVDESYRLEVNKNKIIIQAVTSVGILRGLETVRQLITRKDGKAIIPEVRIADQPRYRWRGLMIDVSRHWIPKDVILRNLDAMASVKMNVLHLHLSDAQAFRVESKLFPLLQEKGASGNYFTTDDLKEMISYASDRGIRIVPEFDLPGHSQSWFAGYPFLASSPGPFSPDTAITSNDVLDPTREEVYSFLGKFTGEMACIFPDPYYHTGGDEVNPKQWNENTSIRTFMKKHDFQDAHDLQTYFNRRMQEILETKGKIMTGWDEILNPGLSRDVLIQCWRNRKSLFEAVRHGNPAILSAGYYLDHKLPAGYHYNVDPEILPGSVNIDPDSSNWQKWDLTIKIQNTEINGSLVIFGRPGNLRGFFALMNNYVGFTTATLNKGQFETSFHTDYGNITFKAVMNRYTLTGKMSLGIIGLDATGKKTGGNDMKDTEFPRFENINPLTNEEKTRVLGGEACMWSEMVNDKTIESRIWPRLTAIAERLWSPADVANDPDDMYRRLQVFNHYLATLGIRHIDNNLELITALAGEKENVPVLKKFIGLLEEAKYFDRIAIYKNFSVHTPLNRVVDAALPESMAAYRFSKTIDSLLSDSENRRLRGEAVSQFREWKTLARAVRKIMNASVRLDETGPVIRYLDIISDIGLNAMETFDAGTVIHPELRHKYLATIDSASAPHAGVILAVAPAVRKLVSGLKTQ